MDLIALSQQCAAPIPPEIMQAVMRVESGMHPYAIGVVDGRLERQPRNLAEAIATARALQAAGWNFSLGVAQVNLSNLPKYKLDFTAAFDPCSNMGAAAAILKDCFARAQSRTADDATAWKNAFSCYYSGNFKTGFKPDFKGQPSYVNKVLASMNKAPGAAWVNGSSVAAPGTNKASLPVLRTKRETGNDAWTTFGAKEV